MNRAWYWCFPVAVALAITLASISAADLYHNKRLVFAGRINHGDPVNLLWFGGQSTEAPCGGNKDANCVVRAFDYWDGMRIRFCNGGNDGQLRMLIAGGGGTVNPANDTEVSGSTTCKKQYHARIWGDSAHGHPTPVWALAPIHHENRPSFSGGHTIDRPWEIAEYDAMEGVGHSGHYCTYRDWRALPGSGGKIKANRQQNGYSDGFITRMSWQQHSGTRTCHGA
jgi:hypothetical protein